MKNFYLYVIVSGAGAAVLAIEILGTRVLGPFYGVSLFLWSALISVTLIALSVGYAAGGRWADRGATLPRLCSLTTGAGVWLLMIPWLKGPVLAVTQPFGLRFAVLTAAFVLFAPPLTLLGMVSPYGIKLKTTQLNEIGQVAGNLFALSTCASVCSALLTGFFLIPNVGVSRLLLIIGVLLLGLSAPGLAEKHTALRKAVTIFVLLLGGICAVWNTPVERAVPEKGLIALEHSAYAEIRVLDIRSVRHLLIDGGVHTIVDRLSGNSRHPYVEVIAQSKAFFAEPGKLLLIGLGGGSIAKTFGQAGWRVDVVEIDPVVTKVAKEHFGLESFPGRIFHVDGRQFLTTHPETYDVLVLDAFGSGSIPFHLVTQEVFGLMAQRLNPGGVLVMNVEARGWHDVLVRALAATLCTHFSEVLALPTVESPQRLGNVVLLASNKPLTISGEEKALLAGGAARAWARRFRPQTDDVSILTDELNPVDIWSEEINFVARQELHRYFAQSGMSW